MQINLNNKIKTWISFNNICLLFWNSDAYFLVFHSTATENKKLTIRVPLYSNGYMNSIFHKRSFITKITCYARFSSNFPFTWSYILRLSMLNHKTAFTIKNTPLKSFSGKYSVSLFCFVKIIHELNLHSLNEKYAFFLKHSLKNIHYFIFIHYFIHYLLFYGLS